MLEGERAEILHWTPILYSLICIIPLIFELVYMCTAHAYTGPNTSSSLLIYYLAGGLPSLFMVI